MQVFHCQHCGQTVFFENDACVRCGHALGYDAVSGRMETLRAEGGDLFTTIQADGTSGRLVRRCAHHEPIACNWLVDGATKNGAQCVACAYTTTIPDLTIQGNTVLWSKLEAAKRRLVHGLHRLGLFPLSQRETSGGLAFEFLADPEDPDEPAVLTGHFEGTVTVNIAEADDAEREHRRQAMREPYRTLLGHLRHEVGHFFWDALVRTNPAALSEFRVQFGDETASYDDALQRHYEQGAPQNWQPNFISSYATSHPWEDWAETFAHYLHICDGLETAHACAVQLTPANSEEPAFTAIAGFIPRLNAMKILADQWSAISYLQNNLNRSMGVPDGYPFVLSETIVAKLDFIHRLVQAAPNPCGR
jgi:hypothetical protein